mmetsp:Transcript_30340/g.69808  ORF Transcript_30340/g.69808 Transcript_30340/m.69808 type:complete len:450 (-) Transcript_30340:39-1388(-)
MVALLGDMDAKTADVSAVKQRVADAVFAAQESGALARALELVIGEDDLAAEEREVEEASMMEQQDDEARKGRQSEEAYEDVVNSVAAAAVEEPKQWATPGNSTILDTVRGGRVANLAVLLKSTKQRQLPDQTKEEFMARLTHLHMERKGLDGLGDVLGKLCTRLRVLYLADNRLRAMGPLPPSLEVLQVPGNQLTEMGSWSMELPKLHVLDIRDNKLSLVEGLRTSRHLRELFVSGQQNNSLALKFDPATISTVANSLQVLDVGRNQLESLAPLAGLRTLERLDATRNFCRTVESVAPALSTMPRLLSLAVEGNPMWTEVPKCRDELLLLAAKLEELDGKPIQQGEHVFLMELTKRRRARSRGQAESKLKKPSEGKSRSLPPAVAQERGITDARRRYGDFANAAPPPAIPSKADPFAAGQTRLPPLLPGGSQAPTLQRFGRTRGHDAPL